jgi:hypothetical protein
VKQYLVEKQLIGPETLIIASYFILDTSPTTSHQCNLYIYIIHLVIVKVDIHGKKKRQKSYVNKNSYHSCAIMIQVMMMVMSMMRKGPADQSIVHGAFPSS